MTIGRVGAAATMTKPVTNVPNRAPAVPKADRPPTTLPVSSSELSRSLATMGLIAVSTVAGAKNDTVASNTIAAGSLPSSGPSTPTIHSDHHASAPPMASAGPMRVAGS